MEKYNISENPEANRLINNVAEELRVFSDGLIGRINKLTSIGIALSSEKHVPRLLEMIVNFAREFTNAEGGTLYTVSSDRKSLTFEILQNTKLNVHMGGTAGEITWPPVQLYEKDSKENFHNVSAYVALTGKTVNIPDVYDVKGYDFSGTRMFDEKNSYRSKSMLVVPLKDHENEIIGVLQLLNAKSFVDERIVKFSPEAETIILSLASQAAVTLTQNELIHDLEKLFASVIRTIAKAIDEKSPYTAGHIKRVTSIAMTIANKINEKTTGPFANIKLSDDELKELQTAAWMHDMGKITTPEHIIDKATKLEKVYDRSCEIRVRFEVLRNMEHLKFLNDKLSLLEKYKLNDIPACEAVYKEKINKINDDLEFILRTNVGGEFLSPEKEERLRNIAKIKWICNGEEKTILTYEELYNLSISRGTLTKEEKEKMQDHVRVTEVMLNELPFPSKLKNVPKIASADHATLTGTGYHKHLKAEEIPLQARILALADIFEALSSRDRPYKKGKTISEVKKILEFMVKDKHIDKDLYDLFINDEIFKEYVKAEFLPEQIDVPI
ncbi:HD domain-containing protein [Candidatus Desantisbacteria bacterium]|nr:HD domain-containing protein [Candidatus Desantisbacteria bacterium]